MGRRLNLSHLTEEECEQILKVIQKDFDIRQIEKERLALVEAKVKEEDARLNILATRKDFNDKYCMICFKKFLFFLVPKTQCFLCRHCYCNNCISFDVKLKANICSSCQKYHEYLLQSNSWFYKSLGDKFKRFGSAKVIRSLYKRKTESDAESDSGYHPSIRENVCLSESNAKRSRPNLSKVFEMDETYANNDEDEPTRALSFYKKKLEAIKRRLRKAFLESKGSQENSQRSIYEDALNKQAFNISIVLSSMINDLTSNLNDSSNKDQNASKETISKYILEQCIDHIYEPSPTDTESFHPFGIDPEDLTLRGYIEKLSDAILSKMNADLKSSEDKIFQQEEEEVRKELLKLSNRARITQMGKEFSDSEMEDLQVTTDSISDIDGKEWQMRHSADSTSASSLMKQEPPSQIDYDESEYDVDESSIFAFASRKKGTLVLPVLGSNSSTKQPDVDLEVTSQKASPSAEDPWTLSANGPATIMSNRIPIAPYDNYGEKKCGPMETEGDLKMFLPKRHSIEGPMIDFMNVYELSDLSDGSLGSPFEEIRFLQDSSLRQEVPEEAVDRLVNSSPKDSVTESNQSLIPWFEMAPQDDHVFCGEEFTCCCKIDGAKPIDVFWYRDEDKLIQLGSDDRHTVLDQNGTHKLIVSNSQTSDDGIYHCVAINEHGTCQHTFTITVLERNGFHERSADTSWRNDRAMTRLTNAHQDKPELNTGPSLTTSVKVDTYDEKGIGVPTLEVNKSQKQEDGYGYSHLTSSDNSSQLWDLEKNNSSKTVSDILTTGSESQYEQNILDCQKSNNGEDILHKNQPNEKMTLIRNVTENEKRLSKNSSETVLDENASYNDSHSTARSTKRDYFLQSLENSEVSETSKGSLTTSTTGQQLRDSYSPYKANKHISREITNEFPRNSNVFADISPLETESEQNQPRRHHTVPSHGGEVLSKSSSTPLYATSHGIDKKTAGGRFDFPKEVKSLERQSSDSINIQHPKDINDGLPKIDYKRYSRDYEVRNKDDSPTVASEGSKPVERKISTDINRSTRRSSNSSAGESDVFEPDRRSYACDGEAHFNSISRNIAPATVKSDLDDIVLPSVKLLRMKFNAPRDTSAAEALLRKKNRPESKLNPETKYKWKSAERLDPLFPSSHLPISVVPLQPAPINSRSMSRSSVAEENLPQWKPETKFQEEVIIRQQIVNKSHSNEFNEELRHSEPPKTSSVAGRVVIRPFSQRADSTSSESGTSYHGK